MSLPQPDHGVLRKAQRGDERAFSIIVRAYQTPVYNYVLRMVGDRSLAEDLTQEVFLRVYQGLPRFSSRSKFTTWLFQVTKNRVLDELRATERRPRAVVDLDDMPPLEVVDAPFERLEAIDAVWRAVERLNVDLKMALLLRDIVGLSYTEIADSLEVTLATVKWRIWKAREDVQLALAREGIEVFEEREVPAVAAVPVVASRPCSCPCRFWLRPRFPRPRDPAPDARRASRAAPRPASRSACAATSYSARRKLGVLRVEIQEEVGGARVAVPRLTDRAGIEERPRPVELELRAGRGHAAVESSPDSTMRNATWLCPTSTSGESASSSVARAASSLSTYSQIGSRAEPW